MNVLHARPFSKTEINMDTNGVIGILGKDYHFIITHQMWTSCYMIIMVLLIMIVFADACNYDALLP